MRAEFYRLDDPQAVLGTARWDGRHAVIEAEDEGVRASLRKVFRPTPMVVDDASLRPIGVRVTVTVQPGSMEWFREAALTRATPEGLRARIVPEARSATGWDPASAYRTFRQVVSLLESPAGGRDPEAESSRPV